MPLKNLILKKIKKFNFSKYIYKIKINFKFIKSFKILYKYTLLYMNLKIKHFLIIFSTLK